MKLFAHWFFPRYSNNYKAKILRPSGLLSLLIVFVFAQFVVGNLTKHGFILGESSLSVEKIVAETNKKREQAGLSNLKVDSKLQESAVAKGQDMVNKSYWAHVGPNGETPWSFFTQNGYEYRYAGENLARDFNSSDEVVAAWMTSTTHRENLLSPKYQDIGVAIVQGDFSGKPITIVVQHFGTRAGIALEPQIEKGSTNLQSGIIPISQNTFGANVSAFQIKKNLSLGIVGFLLVILAVDGVVVSHLQVIRISGRTLAHFGFLVSVGILLFLAAKGTII